MRWSARGTKRAKGRKYDDKINFDKKSFSKYSAESGNRRNNLCRLIIYVCMWAPSFHYSADDVYWGWKNACCGALAKYEFGSIHGNLACTICNSWHIFARSIASHWCVCAARSNFMQVRRRPIRIHATPMVVRYMTPSILLYNVIWMWCIWWWWMEHIAPNKTNYIDGFLFIHFWDNCGENWLNLRIIKLIMYRSRSAYMVSFIDYA